MTVFLRKVLNFIYSVKTDSRHLSFSILGIKISIRKNYHSVKYCTAQINKLKQKIKLKVKNGDKLKVYFIIYDMSQWSFQSLYEAMDKDPMFEPTVLIFPAWLRGKESTANEDLVEYIKKLGLRYVIDLDEKNLPDIIFTTMPYYNEDRTSLNIADLYNKVLFCFHIYGWLLTDDDWLYFSNEHFKYFWKEYVPSKRDYNAAVTRGVTGGKNVVCSGYLKNDCFDKASNISKIWNNPNSAKFIYAPHYSLYNGGHSLSTFHKYYDKIYQYLLEHPEIEIVLKPHPLLRRFIGDKDFQKTISSNAINFMTFDEYDEYIRKWEALPNGHIVNTGEYYELFKSSDAIILDSESFVAEYMYQNKPICFCNKYNSLSEITSMFNQMGKDMFNVIDVAQSWDDIVRFIESVVNNNDEKIEQRTEIIQKYLHENNGHVGEFIKNDIKKSLM